MKLYRYVIVRDFGFAPNPYFGYCTLATCKPKIRNKGEIGDWIAAFGGSGTPVHKKLVCLMKVSEVLSFDEYWNDKRFIDKKPSFNKSMKYCYGDNIYHHDKNGEWRQENSHHSLEDGSMNIKNFKKDTSADKVLICNEFRYFGDNALSIPEEYSSLICSQINHLVETNEDLINSFTEWVLNSSKDKINGIPFSLNHETEMIRYDGN